MTNRILLGHKVDTYYMYENIRLKITDAYCDKIISDIIEFMLNSNKHEDRKIVRITLKPVHKRKEFITKNGTELTVHENLNKE
jgi:hypothetical protein